MNINVKKNQKTKTETKKQWFQVILSGFLQVPANLHWSHIGEKAAAALGQAPPLSEAFHSAPATAVTAISHQIRKFPQQKAKSNANVSGPASLSAQIELDIIPVLHTGALILAVQEKWQV